MPGTKTEGKGRPFGSSSYFPQAFQFCTFSSNGQRWERRHGEDHSLSTENLQGSGTNVSWPIAHGPAAQLYGAFSNVPSVSGGGP